MKPPTAARGWSLLSNVKWHSIKFVHSFSLYQTSYFFHETKVHIYFQFITKVMQEHIGYPPIIYYNKIKYGRLQ